MKRGDLNLDNLSDDELAELETLVRKATPEGADEADPDLLIEQERTRLVHLLEKAVERPEY